MRKSLNRILSIMTVMGLVLTFFTACEIGMGEAVDLEAPSINVQRMVSGTKTLDSAFETSIYCRSDVTFSGVAEDNEKVTRVHAEVKFVGDASYSYLADAALNGNAWTLHINFDREGPCYVKIVAEDRPGNYGIKSSKVITLFVDNNAPVGDAWYIDRKINGIQYSLQSKEALQEIVRNDPTLAQPSNIDVAQNVDFDICSAFSDASGIREVTISIWDEDGNLVLRDIPNTVSSNYAPRFNVTHSALAAAAPSLATGLHYLQVRYSAEDTVTDPSSNSVEDFEMSLGWFIWWPEKDNPRYSISDLIDDGNGNRSLALHVGDSVSITVFDDDYLSGNVVCTLSGSNPGDTATASRTASANQREMVLIVTAPANPQDMSLRINANSKGNHSIDETIPVRVSDDSTPTLIITKPENNQIPSLSGSGNNSVVEFKGVTLDTLDCTYLEFVWVPDSVTFDKKSVATSWLNSIRTTHSSYAPQGSNAVRESTVTYNYTSNAVSAPVKLKVWSAKLSTPASGASVSGFNQKEFDFTVPFLTAFNTGTTEETNEKAREKYFLVRLTRTDGNYSDSELKLSADNLAPEIKLLSPGGNMAIVDPGNDLNIRFYAEKASSIPMEEYKLWHVKPDGTEEEIAGTAANETINGKNHLVFTSSTIAQTVLEGYQDANENPKYKFYAKDKLGNEYTTNPPYQFVLSSKPTINTITSQAPVKCGYNQVIDINVSFTKPLTCPADAVLNLQNITNGGTAKTATASYYSGSGTTTITFRYTVAAGDESTELRVNGATPITGIDANSANLTLSADNNLQAKRASNPITINGVRPKVTSFTISTPSVTNTGMKYLKEGREIEVRVAIDKPITVQGTPTLRLFANTSTGLEPVTLSWQKTEDSGQTLVFYKKILKTDENGALSYTKNTCITSTNVIKDDYGNELEVSLTGGNTSEDINITIDTVVPVTPVISAVNSAYNNANGVLKSGKYSQGVLTFRIPTVSDEFTQYSTDGGSTWTPATLNYSQPAISVTQNDNAVLIARRTDRAGNVSVYSKPIIIEVNSTFPSYTVECTKPDGNYKAGTDLFFKVYFDRPVNISNDSEAFIKITNKKTSGHTDDNTKAVLKATEKGEKSVETATFVYTTRDPDEFALQVLKQNVTLTGFTDEYGNPWVDSVQAKADYERPNLHCDGVPPRVKKMEMGTSQTQIKLTFTEDIQLGTGKLYLRQVKGWAIPPVLTASEFNTICNAIPSDYIRNGTTGKNILAMQENGSEMEDTSWNGVNNNGPANSGYHGTGQYVGPYKKGTQGVNSSGSPDLSTKYVLDFDMGIWETNEAHYYGKTGGTETTSTYSAPAQTEANKRTADDIRDVLEKVHYHERYISVTATTIASNNREVTINFPKGLLGDSTLPAGRKWELVIEKGCFMDSTGNKFGAEVNGSIKQADAIQDATNGTRITQTEEFGSWGRGRASLESGEKPVVLIKNNGEAYFESNGVAKPVIRVDRYSYGYGIFQSDANGAKASQIANGGSTKPTGYVRVRVDCETEGASVTYNKAGQTKDNSNRPNTATYSNDDANSYITTNNASLADVSLTTGATTTNNIENIIFAAGSGDYTKSYKGYVKAKATKGSAESGEATEGIFQTVVRIVNPQTSNNTSYAGRTSDGGVFSVRGTTGFAGEPSISPFPLRDNLIGSPFIRQTYKERSDSSQNTSNDYYWVSYEILLMSSISGYGSTSNDANDFNWMKNWGQMNPGEFSRITGFKCWN